MAIRSRRNWLLRFLEGADRVIHRDYWNAIVTLFFVGLHGHN